MSCIAPVLRGHSLSFYIHIAEDVYGLMVLLKFFIVHVASLFVLVLLIGFQNGSLKRIDICQYYEIPKVRKMVHQELSLFFMHRLVVKTNCLSSMSSL